MFVVAAAITVVNRVVVRVAVNVSVTIRPTFTGTEIQSRMKHAAWQLSFQQIINLLERSVAPEFLFSGIGLFLRDIITVNRKHCRNVEESGGLQSRTPLCANSAGSV